MIEKKAKRYLFNRFVPTSIKIHEIKIIPIDRFDHSEHKNHLKFCFGGNLFDLGEFQIPKMSYRKNIPDIQIIESYACLLVTISKRKFDARHFTLTT